MARGTTCELEGHSALSLMVPNESRQRCETIASVSLVVAMLV